MNILFHFAALIAVCAIFIYVFENRIRRFIAHNLSPFDEELIKMFGFVSRVLGNNPLWSNVFLSVGLTLSFCLFSYSIKVNNALMVAMAMFIQFISILFSASFTGQTWVNRGRAWFKELSQNKNFFIILSGLSEISALVFITFPFVFLSMLMLLAYADGSDSTIRVQLVFYFLPIFFVMWVYRLGHNNELILNIKRILVYLIIAIAILSSNDPIVQLANRTDVPDNALEFFGTLNQFSIISFLTFDRIGKIIIELTKQKSNLSMVENDRGDSYTAVCTTSRPTGG
ncbi:MAG: hypothetical protein VR67_05520 [Peptococcaceae bacterium BRH_c8a]|nr:MAG: hypothetical protein VR67_05520 [Peptococcaceae bacterium BRH_c8a]